MFLLLTLGCMCERADTPGDTAVPADTAQDTAVDSGIDSDSAGDSDSASDTAEALLWSISGTTKDVANKTAGAEGLTVQIADPTDAFSGGTLLTLGEGVTAADGSWAVNDVSTTSDIGVLMVVSGGANMNTATRLGPSAYESLGADGMIVGKTAYIVSNTMAGVVDGSAALLGYEGSILDDGALFIMVRDAEGEPLGGATVTCGGCTAPIYYFDDDSSDGLFSTAGVANIVTSSAAGMAVVPTGPVATYEAAGDSQYTGTLSGLATFIVMTEAN